MRVHHLKVKNQWLVPLERRKKTCELRKNDRDFRVDDYIILKPIDKYDGAWQNCDIVAKVTHVLHHEDFPFGLTDGYCILSISKLSKGPEKERVVACAPVKS